MGTSQYRMWLGYSSCKQGFIAVVGGLVPFILSLSSSLLHLMHQPSSLQAAAHSGLVPWATLLLMALCHLLCHRAIVVLVPPTTHPTNLHTKERWDKTPWRASSSITRHYMAMVDVGKLLAHQAQPLMPTLLTVQAHSFSMTRDHWNQGEWKLKPNSSNRLWRMPWSLPRMSHLYRKHLKVMNDVDERMWLRLNSPKSRSYALGTLSYPLQVPI